MADITLVSLLEESQKIKNNLEESIKIFNFGISEINISIKELDKLINKAGQSDSDKYELIQYKSSIFQIKSDYTKQLDETKKNLKLITDTIYLIEKSIQLNTGDIF